MASTTALDFDTVTLEGEPLERAKTALRIARHQVHVASGGAENPRLETVLEDIEDDISGHLKRIDDAVEDDADDLPRAPSGGLDGRRNSRRGPGRWHSDRSGEDICGWPWCRAL
jgi:hypothetical protein